MANEKEDVLKANEGGPAANIPDLKKKEKERKKAGAAWGGARGAASEFSGATGGVARAAASAAEFGAEGALAGAEELGADGIWATISRFFAGLTSTLAGKMALAAAAFLLAAAAGLVGYGLMKGNGNGSVGSPNLGGIADSMRVRAGGDDRLAVNSNGEVRFDPLSAAKPAAAPAPADAKAGDAVPDAKADADAQKAVPSGQLAHNLTGAQLSSSLGGDFGNKNIFGGNSNAPKFGAGMGNLNKFPGQKGKLGAMQASNIHATPSARNIGKGSANKAFGQLRLAKGLSQIGSGANTAEGAAAAAQGAFDQQQPTGGNLATTGAPGGDTPSTLGGTPPDTGVGAPPTTPTAGGTDPGLQSAIQQISDLANKAMSDIQTGTMEEMIGALLIGIGIGLECTPWSWMIGAAFIVAGGALLMMGQAKVAQGKQEAQQAIQMGQQLGQSIGNAQQANAINYCTNNAVTNNVAMQDCQPPDSITNYSQEDPTAASDINQVHQIPVGTAKVISQ